MQLTIRWVPAHVNVEGNERADQEAKKAARGDTNVRTMSYIPPILRRCIPYNPVSIFKTKRHLETKKAMRTWLQSKRHRRLQETTGNTMPGSYQKLTKDLHRIHTSLLIQLRTGHAPLQYHLHRIRAADSPICPSCEQHNETVRHFLLHCHTYEPQRQRLFYAIGPDARDLQRLLSTRKHLPALFDFIRASRRFQQTFERIPDVELPDNKKH